LASAFTHAFFAAALGTVMVPSRPGLVALGALCAVVPDADVVAFAFGFPYEHMLGHRGASHSVAFAAAAAALLAWAWSRRRGPDGHVARSTPAWRFFAPSESIADPSLTVVVLYLFLSTASHGLLDALTDGGLGVAFFAPFSGERFFFPWRPIAVSPISIRSFFTERGLTVLANELVVVWLPSTAVAFVALASRRWQRSSIGRG
jgi:inner membrane protein